MFVLCELTTDSRMLELPKEAFRLAVTHGEVADTFGVNIKN